MAGEKPTAAMVLSVIGGVFILLGGIVFLVLASIFEGLLGGFGQIPTDGGTVDPGVVTAAVQTLAIIGIVVGLLVIVFGVLMYVKPAQAKIFGALVLVLSIVSWFGGAGFFLGLILGLIGGILGLVWKPTPPAAMYAAPPAAPPSTPPPQ